MIHFIRFFVKIVCKVTIKRAQYKIKMVFYFYCRAQVTYQKLLKNDK